MTTVKFFKESLTIRFLFIGFLILAMLVPMMMVKNLIRDRGNYYNIAMTSIKDGWADAQILSGPFLVVPYTYKQEFRTHDRETGAMQTSLVDKTGQFYILPETATVQGEFLSESRKRGLFSVPIYSASIKLTGTIKIPNIVNSLPADQTPSFQMLKPYLALKLSDPRGLHSDFSFRFGGEESDLKPGTQIASIGGIHAPLAIDIPPDSEHSYDYDISFKLKGTHDFQYIPMARQNDLNVRSNWPHPSFGGHFLPASHNINEDGFTAEWSVSALATNIEEKFSQCVNNSSLCGAFEKIHIGIGFFQNMDLYAKVLRSTKYGILFLGLTFMAFFMFEVLKRFKIHPLQYLMVGGALTIFYMLLLALAEHTGFGPAYILASLSVCLLLGYYIAHIVRSARIGGAFGMSTLILYGLLYVILGSEDYALLMGTGLLFTVLAAMMVLTRKMDWYSISFENGKENDKA